MASDKGSSGGGRGGGDVAGGSGSDPIRASGAGRSVAFGDSSGAATIADFAVDHDVIEIASTGIASFDDIVQRMVADDGDTLLTLPDGSSLRWSNVGPDELTEQNFRIVRSPVCFTPGTLILAPGGEVPVEDLAPGVTVVTADAGPQPIVWIGRRVLRFGPGADDHKPIEFKAGALGGGLPRRALRVSPQHRLLMRGALVWELFGVEEILAPAKGLTGLAGVRRMNGKREVEYVTLLLDRHHVLVAEGAETESFYPGPTALSMLPAAQRGEVLALLPVLRDAPEAGYGPPARRVLTLREARSLCARLAGADPNTEKEDADHAAIVR